MANSEELKSRLRRERAENQRLRRERKRLERERGRLEKENEELRRERGRLEERIERLELEMARQAAPFRRRPSRKVPPEKRRKPGRKEGHAGRRRPVPGRVDREFEAPLAGCPECGGPVGDVKPVDQYVEEIVPARPEVWRVRTYRGRCRRCGPVRSRHERQVSEAVGAAAVQVGPRTLGLAALLNKSLGLTMRTTCRVMEKMAGLRLSPGGLSQALDRTADSLRADYKDLRGDLRQAPAAFVDETSWWVGEPQWWLWVHATPETTFYQVEPSRGSQVVLDTLGPDFRGTLVSDCLASYDPPGYAKHKCIAHHMKAIARARDRPDTPDPGYLDEWAFFFTAVRVLHSTLKGRPAPPKQMRNMERWRDRLLERPVPQPGDQIVRNRLLKQRLHLLGCLSQPAAEPTNNRAERALRPAVIARKLSCGNKTPRGKRTWETLASLAATCNQRGVDFAGFVSSRLFLDAPRAPIKLPKPA